jgi:hypothetical protein
LNGNVSSDNDRDASGIKNQNNQDIEQETQKEESENEVTKQENFLCNMAGLYNFKRR